MKMLLISLLIFCFYTTIGQINNSLPTFQVDHIYLDDTYPDHVVGLKIPLRRVLDKNDGKLTKTDNGFSWECQLEVTGASAVVAYFDQLALPLGSKIRALSPLSNKSTQYFHKNNNEATQAFAFPFLRGETIIIQAFFDKITAYEQFQVQISEVGGLTFSHARDFGDALSCFANVNCSEGSPWQDQKRSVAKYMLTTDGAISVCTGSLVNNSLQDCKNYFLTAQHCGISLGSNARPSSVQELGQAVFYFNYEAPNCTSPANDNGLANQTVVGCTRKAQSGDGTSGMPEGSDFLLLELSAIPPTYNVYYAGWNRALLAQLQGNGAIIQHPMGDLKKISFWDTVVLSGTSSDHLYAQMIASANGDGTTQGSASGSPIFDINKQVIANVTNGDSDCISNITGTPIVGAGMFYYHWNQNQMGGTSNNRGLKTWLDPNNSGVTSLAGKQQCGIISSTNKITKEKNIHLYPTPFNNVLHIESTTQDWDMIEIFDLSGKLVYSKKYTTTIHLNNLSNGMYLLKLSSSQAIKTLKIVKK